MPNGWVASNYAVPGPAWRLLVLKVSGLLAALLNPFLLLQVRMRSCLRNCGLRPYGVWMQSGFWDTGTGVWNCAFRVALPWPFPPHCNPSPCRTCQGIMGWYHSPAPKCLGGPLLNPGAGGTAPTALCFFNSFTEDTAWLCGSPLLEQRIQQV